MCYILDFARLAGKRHPSGQKRRRQQAQGQGPGFGEITALRITLPHREPPFRVVREAHEAGLVSFGTGDDHLAEIEFDRGSASRKSKLRLALPLRFRW